MPQKIVLALLLAAALGGGWLLGSQSSDGSGTTASEVEALHEEIGRLRMALGERGPVLQTGAALHGSTALTDGTESGDPGSFLETSADPVNTFDIATFHDPDKAFQALLAYAATKLAEGAKGQLELLETLNRTFMTKPGEGQVQELLGSKEQAVRFIYPVIRFAMNHDAEVADMTETVFRTMAEDPQRLAEMDKDTLEIFTEGIAFMLPGMVGPKRLETMREYARATLLTSEDRQPQSVRRSRRNIQRALESWAPAVSSEEALQRLQQGTLSAEEAMAMLKRLSPEEASRLDIEALLGPILETDGHRAVSLIGRLKPDASTLARLDQRLIKGVIRGRTSQSLVEYYLRYTGRYTWEKARLFIETGLQQASRDTAGTFMLAALRLRPGPDQSWVDWAEQTYEFSDRVRLALKNRRHK